MTEVEFNNLKLGHEIILDPHSPMNMSDPPLISYRITHSIEAINGGCIKVSGYWLHFSRFMVEESMEFEVGDIVEHRRNGTIHTVVATDRALGDYIYLSGVVGGEKAENYLLVRRPFKLEGHTTKTVEIYQDFMTKRMGIT
jgi:hypothetical protein